jgi:hypothetical protein
VVFEVFPDPITIGIVPTASALCGLIGGSVRFIQGYTDEIGQKTAEGALVGGWFGTSFYLAGLVGLI